MAAGFKSDNRGTLTLVESAVNDSAPFTGGIFNGGTLMLEASTIRTNSACVDCGGQS